VIRRGALALLPLGVAAVLALLAADAAGWHDAIRSGDRTLVASPTEATWHSASVLPGDPAKSLLALDTPLAFRAAQQSFVAVEAAGTGYDNGVSEARTRGELEAQLSELARGGDHVLASAADNLLGILAYADATPSGPIAPAPVDQAVADFGAAIRLDPADDDAKVNLELLLDALRAKGTRSGSSNSVGGPAKGKSGAGGGIPGRGY
jgi:hypothetical protein